jgi:hypothetical protein
MIFAIIFHDTYSPLQLILEVDYDYATWLPRPWPSQHSAWKINDYTCNASIMLQSISPSPFSNTPVDWGQFSPWFLLLTALSRLRVFQLRAFWPLVSWGQSNPSKLRTFQPLAWLRTVQFLGWLRAVQPLGWLRAVQPFGWLRAFQPIGQSCLV